MRLLAILAMCLISMPVSAITASYYCDDGSRLRATFRARSGTRQATLYFDSSKSSLTLPQVMSADGGRYADKNNEFWVKGRTARLKRPDSSVTCTIR